MENPFEKSLVLQKYKNEMEKFLAHSHLQFSESGYEAMVKESLEKRNKFPFLSIIVRTQGKREESLREVFLCLNGQSNQDFEVLVIGHKLNDEQYYLVQQIIDQQEEELKNKIRYIALDYGNRTAPLNVGFAKAWGEYIVTLDDDDIVLDNWVEEFKNASEKFNGEVLYNYTLAQNWSVLDKGDYLGGLRAESAFDTQFCHDYNAVNQIELNKCPPVGLAYPASAFQQLGIIFDESLATTEDWDYLMRVAYVCGVHSNKEPACIYRKWVNAETSFTVHKQEEWSRNYKTITEKTNQRMLCLPQGSSDIILQLIKDREWLLSGHMPAAQNDIILNLYEDGLFVKAYQKVNKICPYGSRKRELIKKIARLIIH